MNNFEIIDIDPLYYSDSLVSEVALWRAVINQHLDDLKLPASNKKYRSWIRQSKKWFLEADKDFYLVCEYASISPHYVLQLAHHIMASDKRDR